MLRSTCFVLVLLASRLAAEPNDPTTVVAQAKTYLDAQQPARAILVLEAALPSAGGRPEYLTLLAAAYDAELQELEAAKVPEAIIAALRKKRDLLPNPAVKDEDAVKRLAEGVKLFNLASTKPEKYAEAAKLFAASFRKVEMTPEQTAAWAYCRIRLANEKLTKSTDAGVAGEAIDEVEAALATVPNHAKLREAAESVLVIARQRGGVRNASPTAVGTSQSANFIIEGGMDPVAAKALLADAEARRTALFARWIGPTPPTDWNPKCVLCPVREQTLGGGQAVVELDQGRVLKRRLPILNADFTASADAFNRELTHLLLADLFPFKAPPKWAEIGMAATSQPEGEQARYRTLLQTIIAEERLIPVGELLNQREAPIERLVEFHVQSASLVQFLIVWRGEAHFLSFLKDAERYGTSPALTRSYGTTDVAQLHSLWKRAASAK